MVARMLWSLREVADEIVVAMDSRVDPRTLAPLNHVADTVTRFEYAGTPERARPWLVQLCRNPTVLMLDGDEVPSHGLVSALPELIADPDAQQFRIARRWSFPDESHWLAERPWAPDFQRRLLRRGPLLDFDLRFHGGVRDAAPFRYVAEPIYHLACLLRSFAERRQIARGYEAERPSLLAVGGGSLNDTMYAPEHFATLRPLPTPPEDVELLRAVINSPSPDSGTVSVTRVVPAEEIARHVPRDPLEKQGYRARLRLVENDLRTDPGCDTHVVVEVANTGNAVIPRDDGRGVQVRIATRLLDRRPGAGPSDWTRTLLPCAIPPGEARLVEALVRVPAVGGIYTMEVDLLNERSRWFGSVTLGDLYVSTRWGRYTL